MTVCWKRDWCVFNLGRFSVRDSRQFSLGHAGEGGRKLSYFWVKCAKTWRQAKGMGGEESGGRYGWKSGFLKGEVYFFRSRLVGCDHLAGRFEGNRQKFVFNPEQQKARDHYGSTDKYSEDENTLVESLLIQVDYIAICKRSRLS